MNKELLQKVAKAYQIQGKYEDAIQQVNKDFGVDTFTTGTTEEVLTVLDDMLYALIDDEEKVDTFFDAVFDNGDTQAAIEEITKETEFSTIELDIPDEMIPAAFNTGLQDIVGAVYKVLTLEEFDNLGYSGTTTTVDIDDNLYDYIVNAGFNKLIRVAVDAENIKKAGK